MSNDSTSKKWTTYLLPFLKGLNITPAFNLFYSQVISLQKRDTVSLQKSKKLEQNLGKVEAQLFKANKRWEKLRRKKRKAGNFFSFKGATNLSSKDSGCEVTPRRGWGASSRWIVGSFMFSLLLLLAPTGALIVIVCYYWSARRQATFSDFEHFCQYI